MLAPRNQENMPGPATRGLPPKTPGARYPKTPLKVPLNDENATHVIGGAKGNLTGRARGNENAPTSRGLKSSGKTNLVTPMGAQNRAVLGNKTTNAKARGLQTVNGKGAAQTAEKSNTKGPTTGRTKQRQAQAEAPKLEIHSEVSNATIDEDVEYCPPKPKDLPYESDVFPEGVLTFEGLKKENRLKGYHNYYFNPVDEQGVSLADRSRQERSKKALEEGERRIKEDLENFQWSIEDELVEAGLKTKIQAPAPAPKAAAPGRTGAQMHRRAMSTVASRNAANALSIDDATKSMQRRAVKPSEPSHARSRTASFAIPRLGTSRLPAPRTAAPQKKTPLSTQGMEATSRTTIGYNKGRTTASALAQGTSRPNPARAQGGATRSASTVSNESNRTITPTRFAQRQAIAAEEDQEWKQRVPFLALFDAGESTDEEECDLLAGGLPRSMMEEAGDGEDEFEMKLAE